MMSIPAPISRWSLRPWKRHSLVVGMGGAVYLAYGIYMLIAPLTADRKVSLSLADVLNFDLPLQSWGVVWVGVGILALFSTRWPPESETWGYTCLSALAGAWSAIYFLGMVFLGTPFTGMAGFLVWALVAVLWWGIAGLRNPDDFPKGT